VNEWGDEDVVLVSAIEHYSYCPRQCALIYVERVYDENVFTLRGSAAHARVDQASQAVEHGVVLERALPIWSDRHRLYGRADVVEFHPYGAIVPVEYKVTPKHRIQHARLQLCAQAICLEEMFGRAVPSGAAYSSSSHQRTDVQFTPELRAKTVEIVEAVRKMIAQQNLPPPVDDARCPNCSLVHVCAPSCVAAHRELRCEDFLFLPSDEEVVA